MQLNNDDDDGEHEIRARIERERAQAREWWTRTALEQAQAWAKTQAQPARTLHLDAHAQRAIAEEDARLWAKRVQAMRQAAEAAGRAEAQARAQTLAQRQPPPLSQEEEDAMMEAFQARRRAWEEEEEEGDQKEDAAMHGNHAMGRFKEHPVQWRGHMRDRRRKKNGSRSKPESCP